MRSVSAVLITIGLALAIAAQMHPFGEQSGLHEINAYRDIDYIAGSEYSGGRDRLDVYMPAGASDPPVIVFFHGGGLLIGDKGQGESMAKSLVPRGIGVVASNYRLSPAVAHPAHVQDAAAAFAWAVEHIADYGGDPKRLYLAGHSAGAYLATLLTLDGSYLAQAGVLASAVQGTIAISPFLYVEEVAPDRPKGVWGSDASKWREASPAHYVGSGKSPLLFVYADGDAEWRRTRAARGVGYLRP